MSETVIKRGKPSPHLLRDAMFTRAPEGSKIYCYINTTEGKYALTRREAHMLSNRSERYTARYRKWLGEQPDSIIKNQMNREVENGDYSGAIAYAEQQLHGNQPTSINGSLDTRALAERCKDLSRTMRDYFDRFPGTS